ncbi:MAG: hypothetical protein AAGF94_07580 [Pseudomonadota bacterium]
MRLKLLIFLAFTSLGGCSVFAPPYLPEAEKSMASAYTSISQITACVDLGLCATPASFTAKESDYISAIAGMKTAETIVSNWNPPFDNAPSSKSKKLLLELIDGCRMQLVSLSDIHRKNGVPAGVGLTQPVDVSCNQALRATQAMG